MNQSLDRVAVCIRSVSERTEAACLKLVLSQGVAAENVQIVREQPFAHALRRSFEYGLKMNRRWTACVDADVLLRPGCFRQMLKLAERQRSNSFEIQGMVLDKLFGGARHGGIHFYRTELFDEALKHIPSQEFDLRPEACTLRAMAAHGYPWKSVPYVIGLHDFSQYYSDIFRKCFVHAHKHPQLINYFVAFWRDNAKNDQDYRVALAGLAQGIRYGGDIRISASADAFEGDRTPVEFDEKPEIDPEEWTESRVEDTLREWRAPRDYPLHFWDLTSLRAWQEAAGELGLFRTTSLVVSSIFAALGRHFYRVSLK